MDILTAHSQLLRHMGIREIVHELAYDEQLCGACHGTCFLNMIEAEAAGIDLGYAEAAVVRGIPVVQCTQCYTGKLRHCTYCQTFIDRDRAQCACAAAQAAAAASKSTQEELRRATLPRIKFWDYRVAVVWSTMAEMFVGVAHVGVHLLKYPQDTLFACKRLEPPTRISLMSSADEIIKDIRLSSFTETALGEVSAKFAHDAQAALTLALQRWFDNYVQIPPAYELDNQLIIEVD